MVFSNSFWLWFQPPSFLEKAMKDDSQDLWGVALNEPKF